MKEKRRPIDKCPILLSSETQIKKELKDEKEKSKNKKFNIS